MKGILIILFIANGAFNLIAQDSFKIGGFITTANNEVIGTMRVAENDSGDYYLLIESLNRDSVWSIPTIYTDSSLISLNLSQSVTFDSVKTTKLKVSYMYDISTKELHKTDFEIKLKRNSNNTFDLKVKSDNNDSESNHLESINKTSMSTTLFYCPDSNSYYDTKLECERKENCDQCVGENFGYD